MALRGATLPPIMIAKSNRLINFAGSFAEKKCCGVPLGD